MHSWNSGRNAPRSFAFLARLRRLPRVVLVDQAAKLVEANRQDLKPGDAVDDIVSWRLAEADEDTLRSFKSIDCVAKCACYGCRRLFPRAGIVFCRDDNSGHDLFLSARFRPLEGIVPGIRYRSGVDELTDSKKTSTDVPGNLRMSTERSLA
jgi:hypothetical protein